MQRCSVSHLCHYESNDAPGNRVQPFVTEVGRYQTDKTRCKAVDGGPGSPLKNPRHWTVTALDHQPFSHPYFCDEGEASMRKTGEFR